MNDPKPDGTPEQVHTFGWYMTQYVTSAKEKGASVILLSPIPHKDAWEAGRDFSAMALWDQHVAETAGAYFVDLTLVVTEAYRQIGKEKVDTFFSDRRTHTNDTGARFNASCVIAGLKSLRENPLTPYFSPKGQDVPTATLPLETKPRD